MGQSTTIIPDTNKSFVFPEDREPANVPATSDDGNTVTIEPTTINTDSEPASEATLVEYDEVSPTPTTEVSI